MAKSFETAEALAEKLDVIGLVIDWPTGSSGDYVAPTRSKMIGQIRAGMIKE